MLRGLLVVLLSLLLTACQGQPDRGVVRAGLQVQLEQTQQDLSRQLRLEPPRVKVSRVRVAAVAPLTIGDRPAFRVEGDYDWRQEGAEATPSNTHVPYEIYLQRQVQARTWRLARPAGEREGQQSWRTFYIPPL